MIIDRGGGGKVELGKGDRVSYSRGGKDGEGGGKVR